MRNMGKNEKIKNIKIILCVLLSVLFSVQALAVQASTSAYDLYDKVNGQLFTLEQSVHKVADSIAAYNKPVFETQLTKKERTFVDWQTDEKSITGVIWNRVWAKDKTITLGSAGKNKKFSFLIFKTIDSMKSFAGGIHVGSTTRELEKFLGASLNDVAKALNQMTDNRSVVVKGNKITIRGPVQETDAPEDPLIVITCINGVITEIALAWSDLDLEGCISQEALNFANKQAKEMGMSELK